MPWIAYTGPIDFVDVPRWQIAKAARMVPVVVSDEAARDLATHPEWEECSPPEEKGLDDGEHSA